MLCAKTAEELGRNGRIFTAKATTTQRVIGFRVLFHTHSNSRGFVGFVAGLSQHHGAFLLQVETNCRFEINQVSERLS
jgi:hypothetical protein